MNAELKSGHQKFWCTAHVTDLGKLDIYAYDLVHFPITEYKQPLHDGAQA